MDKAKKVKEMTAEERRAWLSEIGKKGGKTRAKSFTSASQRRARSRLTSEQAATNGKKGALRTIELHGYESLFEGARRKRLASPSPTELVMIGLLKTLKLGYEREYKLGQTLYTLDFYLPKYRLGIEVNGAIHDEGKPGYEKRVQNALRKLALCRAMQIDVITIHHTELGDDLQPVIARIRAAIAPAENAERRAA